MTNEHKSQELSSQVRCGRYTGQPSESFLWVKLLGEYSTVYTIQYIVNQETGHSGFPARPDPIQKGSGVWPHPTRPFPQAPL